MPYVCRILENPTYFHFPKIYKLALKKGDDASLNLKRSLNNLNCSRRHFDASFFSLIQRK